MAQKEDETTSVKLISESYVKPKWLVQDAKQPYHLGPLDLAILSIDPIQKGLLYLYPKNNPNHQQIIIPTLLNKLTHSLCLALVHFYPLAGHLVTHKYEDEHKCLVFVDPNKGPGARIIYASALDLTVSELLITTQDEHPAVRSFFDLGRKIVNHDGHTNPLLSIQVTELLDGAFIGFTMNHTVVDGTSFIHFVNSLSHIFNKYDINDDITTIVVPNPPLYNQFRPVGYGPIFKLPFLEPQEFITRYDPGPLRVRIFHFSPQNMAKLKAKANEEIESGAQAHDGNRLISSFQALIGLVWRSITRARNPKPELETTCNLLINARPRLQPPLSNDYFGNFLSGAQAGCNVEKIMGHGLGHAALLLNQKIVAQNGEVISDVLKMVAQHPFVAQPGLGQEFMYGSNSVVVGGSARFDMYGPEFGLGRAVGVRIGYANKDDGKVTANPGCEGDGSVDLEICLRPYVMATLESDDEFMKFVSL